MVLDYLRECRAKGIRTALVTASEQSLADEVAAYTGLFDEVHGSDGQHNLKGAAKAAFLVERFGAGGYDYIGDAKADMPVWAEARKAITVDAGGQLRGAVDGLDDPLGAAGHVRPHAQLVRALGVGDHRDIRPLGTDLIDMLGAEELVHRAVALPEDEG